MAETHTGASPDERRLRLAIPFVLPGVKDEKDGRIARLRERVSTQTGVIEAHIENQDGRSLLSVLYDPALVPLERLERLASDAGAEIVARYRHETLAVRGMDCGSCAASVEHVVRRLPGVLNVSVNYASEKMKVEYDSTLTDREAITRAVRSLGYRVAPPEAQRADEICEGGGHDHVGHDHAPPAPAGSAPLSAASASARGGWVRRNRGLSLSLLSGLLLAAGFFGERFLNLPTPVALAFYVGAYIAGGFELTRHGLLAALHGRFNVDFLMLAGATGAVGIPRGP